MKKIPFILTALIFPISLFFFTLESSFSAPEEFSEPAIGRLKDGRAYRTDKDGNQLVDYIAELEVNLDQTKRQVSSLEDENKDKQVMIDRLKNNVCPQENSIAERNLIGTQLNGHEKNHESENCRESLIKSNEEILKLQNFSKTIGSQPESVLEKYDLERTKLLNTIKEKDNELLSIRQELLELKNSREKQNLEYREIRAIPSEEIYPEEKIEIKESPMPSEAQTRALQAVRGKISSELNSLSSLIATRDHLYFNQGRKGNSQISFAPSIAKTEEGKDIFSLHKELKEAVTVNQLSYISQDIKEIKGIVQGDISAIKKLS